MGSDFEVKSRRSAPKSCVGANGQHGPRALFPRADSAIKENDLVSVARVGQDIPNRICFSQRGVRQREVRQVTLVENKTAASRVFLKAPSASPSEYEADSAEGEPHNS